MMDIYLTKGDTGIGRYATLENENGPVDLTDADVLFLFGNHEVKPIKQAEKGKVMLAFETEHTAVTNVFRACFKMIYPDGRKETFPSPEEDQIKLFVKECC